jgi:PRTRC genetic system protein B
MYDHNNLTTEILSTFVPQMALIAYHRQEDRAHFLEMRKIDAKGRMGAGMPVSYDFMESLAETFTAAHGGTPHGAMPEHLLYADTRKGGEKYIWYNPPGIRRMYFRKDLALPEGEYHVPGVIYEAGDGWLNVYAFKGRKPEPDGEIYAGPFFNTTNGSVCLGSSRLSKPTEPTWGRLLEYWERRFWETEFTHLGGSENPTRDNLVLVTKASADAPFDPDQLRPMNKKLKDLLR